ncbi:MAG: sulfite exporter TauE/SafE family protein [Mycobacterium sp.]
MSVATVVLICFIAGVVVSVVTAPVGVSGAVFLLPIQLSVLEVPNPAVTPTNLLFNVVSIPGALARYRQRAPLRSPLTRVLLVGTLPGVVAGAVIRVFIIPGPQMFRLFVATLLLPLGLWLCLRTHSRASRPTPVPPSKRFIVTIALGVGVVGGIYGIGGGSLVSPILVGRGFPVNTVAPAALTSTFVTSVAGALTYLLLAIFTTGHDIAPDWTIGIVCGLGGLCGGYLGAHLQPFLHERALRIVLGVLAIATAVLYVTQSLR